MADFPFKTSSVTCPGWWASGWWWRPSASVSHPGNSTARQTWNCKQKKRRKNTHLSVCVLKVSGLSLIKFFFFFLLTCRLSGCRRQRRRTSAARRRTNPPRFSLAGDSDLPGNNTNDKNNLRNKQRRDWTVLSLIITAGINNSCQISDQICKILWSNCLK